MNFGENSEAFGEIGVSSRTNREDARWLEELVSAESAGLLTEVLCEVKGSVDWPLLEPETPEKTGFPVEGRCEVDFIEGAILPLMELLL